MNYFTYLIVTINKKNSLTSYVGYTNNLKKRLNLHNTSKGAKYTRGKKWYLAYYKKYTTKKTAMKEEYKLKKNLKRRAEIKKKFLTKKVHSNIIKLDL